MNPIFMNSENSKTSDPRRLLLNLTDKIELNKYISLSYLNTLLYQVVLFIIHGKI